MIPFERENIKEILENTHYIPSGGAGGEQQRAGRLRDRRGAAGQGAAGEALRPQEDQTRGHDSPVPAGHGHSL